MNFDFSEEQAMLRDQARRFLSEREAVRRGRALLDAGGGFDDELWREMAELGWQGAAIPEEFGGAGLSHLDLCVIAEELGRANAAVPFASSVYLVTEALMRYGSAEQKQSWLPKLATGEVVGAFAASEGTGPLVAGRTATRFEGGRLSGEKTPVSDGAEADLLLVLARGSNGLQLCLADASAAGLSREALSMTDATRPAARLTFDGVPAEVLETGDAEAALADLLDRAAVLVAFEQVGGSEACLEMARDYANQRYAFGRLIGSFQAIKHKLADVYVALELARSNAYFGAWALNADAPELPVAAATARVAGCRAFDLASKENIQTHGGMGFTWELDCHLYYRRAKSLGLVLGSARTWKDRLIARLETRNAA